MTELDTTDEDFTEIVDARISRIDLVGKSANGIPFLIAKADGQAGVLDADFVRELIAKSEPAQESTVTLSGTPAAIAAMIHAAPIRKETDMPDETPVAKADVADPTEPLDTPDDLVDETTVEVDGDPDDPNSPAWEAVDAARAAQALELTFALRRLVQEAQGRESQEAAIGADDEDLDNVFDLDDVLCAIDCIVGVLAPFQANENAEATERQAGSMAALAKGQILKAGRVLSAQNETNIRSAAELLQKVLSTLPAPTDDGQPVAKSEKETTVPEETKTPQERQADAVALLQKAAVEDGWTIAKAKGDPQMAVFDADGKLVGTIDPADLSPIAAPEPPDGGDAAGAEDDTPAAPAAAPADDTTAAAPPAEDAATIPGTDTIAAPAPADDDTVAKAAQAAMNGALAEVLTKLTEKLGQSAETAEIVKGLQERVEQLALMPDDRKSPRLNGATGAAGLALRDGETGADARMAELQKAADDAQTPAEKQAAMQRLAYAKIHDRFAR